MLKRNKWTTGLAISAGSVALVIGSIGVAQAHNGQGSGPQGDDKPRGSQSALVATGTLTETQIQEFRIAMQEAHKKIKSQVTADLVAQGILTPTQADTILEQQETSRKGQTNHGKLKATTTLTETQIEELRTAMRIAQKEIRAEVLANLVAQGTLTQTQAEALFEHQQSAGSKAHGQGKNGQGMKREGLRGQSARA